MPGASMSDLANHQDARLQRLLGGAHLASLRKRLRQRFERAPAAEAIDRFRIDQLTADEYAALAALLGRAPRLSNSLQVDVRIIDASLQHAGVAASLRDALEKLDGPIVHAASERSRRQALWADVVASCTHPALATWLQAPANLGVLKRLANAEPATAARLCSRADAVLARLPAGGITRSQLAAEVLGHAHALDGGQPTAAVVLAVWRKFVLPATDDEEVDVAAGSAASETSIGNGEEPARDIWAKAGVLVNELARPALYLNLPSQDGPNCGAPPGEPAYASLRFLLRSKPSWNVAGRAVYVCENPNLIAIAADHWGALCAPLVCTDGMPAAAQRCLLAQLVKAGARLCYHGDFDWPGLRIGNHVMREYGAQPWRFGAPEYVAAVNAAPRPGQPLAGREVLATWDTELSAAMRAHGLAIDEEAVAALLLTDLEDR
jgi:uncharacterized protein (TIGR02679 family)